MIQDITLHTQGSVDSWGVAQLLSEEAQLQYIVKTQPQHNPKAT